MEELREGLKKDLECKLCLRFMAPAITQYNSGHNIGNTSKPKLQRCPTYREHLNHARKNWAKILSESIEHPCMYKESGCTRKSVRNQ